MKALIGFKAFYFFGSVSVRFRCICEMALRESPSTISSLVLLLVLISGLPTNELRVATNALERIRNYYNSVTMSKNALGICYESSTTFRIGEFVAKF